MCFFFLKKRRQRGVRRCWESGWGLCRSTGGGPRNPPLSVEGYAAIEPVYEELPGWPESTVGVTAYQGLPLKARSYLERLQSLVGVPIDMISTGPEREQTIMLRHPFGA